MTLLGSTEDLIAFVYQETDKVTVEYTNIFLLTYRSFATPKEVVEGLLTGYADQMRRGNIETTRTCRLRYEYFHFKL